MRFKDVEFVSTIDKKLIDFVDIEFVIANINNLEGLKKVDVINKASEFDNIIFTSKDWEISIMDRV